MTHSFPTRRSSDSTHVPVRGGRFDLDAVLKLLAERGINEVQVEAGATLAGAFLGAGLVDELLLYVAPVLLGESARPLFDGLHIDAMTQRRSEEHTSELQSLMRNSYAVFCLK